MSSKNLKLSTIKKKSKEIDNTLKHEITSEFYLGEIITFQPIFDDIKIEELLTEYGQLLNEAEQKEITLSQNMQLYLIQFLAIKYFTHFKSEISSQLLSEDKTIGVLDALEHFRKTGLLYECINNMFLPQEISKLLSRMTDVAATGLLTMNLNEEMMRKLVNLREKNSELFNKLDEINIDNDIVQ